MLQRHPLLLAEWLAARNLLVRARAHALKVIAAGGAALGASAVVLVTLRSQFPAVFAWLLAYRVLMLVAVAAYALFAVGRQRRSAEVRYTQFWLAAAPVRQYSRTLAWDEELDAKLQALTVEQINAAVRRQINAAQVSIVKGGDFKRANVYQ